MPGSTKTCGHEFGSAPIGSSFSHPFYSQEAVFEEVGETAQQGSGVSRQERQRRGRKNQGSWQEESSKTSETKLGTDVKKPVGGQMTHGETVGVKRPAG